MYAKGIFAQQKSYGFKNMIKLERPDQLKSKSPVSGDFLKNMLKMWDLKAQFRAKFFCFHNF